MKYRTIVADPPWRYNVTKPTTRGYKPSSAEGHYPTMTMAEIAELPVSEMADADAHLYLWVTSPRLFGDRNDGRIGPREILERWGFEYKTTLVWVKPGYGMGWWFRNNHEMVLFGVRGKAPIPTNLRVGSVITGGKREHSRKPDSFYDVVERVSPEPRLELFARRQRLGWDTWGNEALGHVEIEGAA
jgi:N6-adenosine-specific RNA methylase IME4